MTRTGTFTPTWLSRPPGGGLATSIRMGLKKFYRFTRRALRRVCGRMPPCPAVRWPGATVTPEAVNYMIKTTLSAGLCTNGAHMKWRKKHEHNSYASLLPGAVVRRCPCSCARSQTGACRTSINETQALRPFTGQRAAWVNEICPITRKGSMPGLWRRCLKAEAAYRGPAVNSRDYGL